jgi:membrane-anchored glycerophosphoryl diester phosphodiesterase (GDPDase)
MLVVKWLLILLGTAVIIALILLGAVIFLDYHVDKIKGEDHNQ